MKIEILTGIISVVIAGISLVVSSYFAYKTAQLNRKSNKISNAALEQTKITDPLVLKVATDKKNPSNVSTEYKVPITLDTDNGKFDCDALSVPAIHVENGNISNVYMFIPDRNGNIFTRTIENSEMINSEKTRKAILDSNNIRKYGVNPLLVHNNLGFYIILIKGFNNDWNSYIVTYKFYDNYCRYYLDVSQPNILLSDGSYHHLSKNDIDTINDFYTKVINRLKGISFIN